MRRIVPTHEIHRRVVEQGRIRMGEKGSKGQPQKLSTFRFTSSDRTAIDAIAALYGGTVSPWPEAPTPGQYQVTVEAPKIRIVLPPDPLAGTPTYEAWSGGGCLRRCDGVECTLALAADARPDAEAAVIPCPCRAENVMLCKPRTRLNVVLREVPFGGTWRLESTGWNAAEELPGMVEMVVAVQERGMVCAELGIGQRMRQVAGRMKRFVVPELSLPESIEALAAGDMRMGALGPAQPAVAALTAPEPAPGEWFEDDEIVDGELVDEVVEGPSAQTAPTGDSNAPADGQPSTHRTQSPRIKALHAGVRDVVRIDGIDLDVNTLRHALVRLVTKDRSESSADLTEVEAHEALGLLDDLLRGDRRFIGVDGGRLKVSAKRASA